MIPAETLSQDALPRPARTVTIRPAERRDLSTLTALIRALAAHHGDAALIHEDRLRRLLFGPARALTALIAEIDGRPVGYAANTLRVRLNDGELGTEITHLFVVPELRGHGIGRALVEAAAEAAEMAGHSYLVIGTHPTNRAAQEAYRRMGLEDLAEAPGPRFVRRLGTAA